MESKNKHRASGESGTKDTQKEKEKPNSEQPRYNERDQGKHPHIRGQVVKREQLSDRRH